MDGDAFPHGILLVQPSSSADSEKMALDVSRRVLAENNCPEMVVNLIETIPVDARHNSKVDRPKLRSWLSENYQGPDAWLRGD